MYEYMVIFEYCASGKDLEKFTEKLNNKIKEGWEVEGYSHSCGHLSFSALLKRKKKKTFLLSKSKF